MQMHALSMRCNRRSALSMLNVPIISIKGSVKANSISYYNKLLLCIAIREDA